jgi:hypothetical protein
MKKAIVVVLLGLVWCTNVFALSQQSAIDQYLTGRKLDSVEGIWGNNYGNINVIAKMGDSYSLIVIEHHVERNGKHVGLLQKGNENYYYGTNKSYYGRSPYPCSFTLKVSVNGNSAVASCTDDRGYKSLFLYSRIWPDDLIAHNVKFKTKKGAVKE